MKKLFVLLIIVIILVISVSCNYSAYKVTSELLSYAATSSPDISDINFSQAKYREAMNHFSAELLKRENEDGNIILSPLSLYLALSMVANGARNNTLHELEKVLGLSQSELNRFCYYMINSLENRNDAKINIANSLWVDKDRNCTVEKGFLDINALYYGMEVYRDSFSKESTKKNINNWIRNKTQNMIKEAIKTIEPEVVLMLINTLYFESSWSYSQYNYNEFNFTDQKNKESKTQFISGKTGSFYSSESAKAVRISLKDNFYFMGILPDDNDIDAYINNFNEQELNSLLSNANNSYDVFWRLPKFTYGYQTGLKETLTDMGIVDLFIPGKADLTNLGHFNGDAYYADNVIQKSQIELDKGGIKAASVTVVSFTPTSAAPQERMKMYIYFNRPFAYAIMDSATNTPLFTGVVKYMN